ncbi:histone-lysine N-methyltransferase ASHH1-like [Forsythia ovata]|uniref:Histone-lysine N-methyltransferase ASHH1-like n=1 Tax=Forsythia ovata TaxID=205694 RepID=A0ABD1T3G5_9LAMI
MTAEDEHFSTDTTSPFEHEWETGEDDKCSMMFDGIEGSEIELEVDSSTRSGSLLPVAANSLEAKTCEAAKLCLEDTAKAFSLDLNIGPGSTSMHKSQHTPNGKAEVPGRKQVRGKSVAKLFTSKEVQAEVAKYEEIKNKATAELNSLYDEIRPAIEEHRWGSQDRVAKKCIHATCSKYK